MAQSIVSICNRALGKLGQDVTIVAMSESSKAGRAFNRTWEDVRDYVLSSTIWPFALRAQALAVSADPPLPGWAYAYAYPDDCLDAIAVMGASGVRGFLQDLTVGVQQGDRDFQKMAGSTGSLIISDLASAWLIYSSRVEDVSQYPPLFVEALACRLAWENAAVLAGEVGLRMRPQLLQDYEYHRSNAAVHELNESAEASLVYVTPSIGARGG